MRLDPGNLDYLFAYCRCLEAIGDFSRALAGFQSISKRLPGIAAVHFHVAECLLHTGNYARAAESFGHSLKLEPSNRIAAHDAAYCYLRLGEHEQAIRRYKQALEDPNYVKAHSALLLALHYPPAISAKDIFREHLRWAKKHTRKIASLENDSVKSVRGRRRRLRIGYVSADFRMHPVSFFVAPILEHHRKSQFSIYCYSNVEAEDSTTRRLRSQADHWIDIRGLTDESVAERIRSDRIDILVDLSGHTGGNRLLVFARKPAPVQVTYLGYPDTTGLDAIDCRITDQWSDPVGASERFHTERLVRLDTGFAVYQPPRLAPRVSSLPANRYGFVTFGCLSNRAKINEDVITCWCAILERVPKSKLLLKSFSTASKADRDHLLSAFTRRGIHRNRLIIREPTPSHVAHLRLYRDIDIALDTFPYNGHTTLCEALWMGVPVIVLAGKTHVARVGVSVLSRVGLPEFIAESQEAYVNLAVETAVNIRRLTTLRRKLRSQMSASSLVDAASFTKSLERAYTQMAQSLGKKVKIPSSDEEGRLRDQ